MSEEFGPLAILFADIARSTQLYDLLGDEEAQSRIASCIACLSDLAREHRGKVIKTIGDEVLCIFPDANDAIVAAMAMQRAMGKLPPVDKSGFGRLNLYVGVHMGHVILDNGDVFGDAVNIAARLVELAKQRQILLTEQTAEALTSENLGSVHSLYQTMIRGKRGPIGVYECVWEQEALTIIQSKPLDALVPSVCLELYYHGQLFMVNQEHAGLTMGRQGYNDLVVSDYCVSRSHARISYRRGQFVFVDQSTNGSYLVIQGEKPLHLKRDQAPLYGSGVLSLGREVVPDSPELIYFRIKL